MSRSLVRSASIIGLAIVASSLAAQQPKRVFTAADYDRAARMLGQNLNGLVVGGSAQVTWLADGRFWYRAATLADSQVILVDPARKTRQPLFNAAGVATALA